MAEGGDVSKCRFNWKIFRPFVPSRSFDAIFYHGSGTPFLTEWKVILDPIPSRRQCEMAFRITIGCLQPERSVAVVEVERIKAVILLVAFRRSEAEFERRGVEAEFERHGFSFSRENRHSLVEEIIIENMPSRMDLCLKVEIELDFRNQNVVPPVRNGLVFRDCDLMALSRELMQQRRYTDLTLRSTDSDEPHNVHSCMLRARWNNFFTEHPDHLIIDRTVETGISNRLLTRILNYIYHGRGRQIPPGEVTKNEFFEVIDKYRLHHLYKTFVKEDSKQERETRQVGRKFSRDYLLDYTTLDPEYHWETRGDEPDYYFDLNIRFRLREGTFFYTLESRSPLRLFARLTLQMAEMRVAPSRCFTSPQFHLQDFVFEPFELKRQEDGSRNTMVAALPQVINYVQSCDRPPAERAMYEYAFHFRLTLGTGRRTLKLSATDGEYSRPQNRWDTCHNFCVYYPIFTKLMLMLIAQRDEFIQIIKLINRVN